MNIVTDLDFMRKPCRLTTYEEVRDLGIREKLIESLDAGYSNGIGLAANQIGFDVRYAIYLPSRIDESRKDESIVCLLNPKIISKWSPMIFPGEGCLSLPYKRFDTWRYSSIIFENTENGKIIEKEAKGIEAVIIQHEIQHLDGILCCDVKQPPKIGRNEPCFCGSGKKFKRCCE